MRQRLTRQLSLSFSRLLLSWILLVEAQVNGKGGLVWVGYRVDHVAVNEARKS